MRTNDEQLIVSVSGMRGVFGQGLTPQTVARYAAAHLRQIFAQHGGSCRPGARFVLARDGRVGSDAVRDVLAATLRMAGLNVVDVGVAMTPTAGVMVRHHGACGGFVVTASHNPQPWCGVKPITCQGKAPAPACAEKLRETFERGLALQQWAEVEQLGDAASDETAAHVHTAEVLAQLEAICPIETIKARAGAAAVDSVNASGAAASTLLLDALGWRRVGVHDAPSGRFPHPPEPLPEHLDDLCAKVREHDCRIGFAQDPDGDRLAIVDETGACVGEEKTLALAVWAQLDALAEEARGAVVVANQSTSRMVEDVAARFGARVVRAKVGEANVVEAMEREDAVIGGEGNGGVVWPRVVLIRDSLSAMALTLALMARTQRPVSALAQELPKYAIVKAKTPRPEHVEAALERVAQRFEGAALDLSDGVRVDLPDKRAWAQARASNTEPIVRLIAEAPTPSDAEALVRTMREALAEHAA